MIAFTNFREELSDRYLAWQQAITEAQDTGRIGAHVVNLDERWDQESKVWVVLKPDQAN